MTSILRLSRYAESRANCKAEIESFGLPPPFAKALSAPSLYPALSPTLDPALDKQFFIRPHFRSCALSPSLPPQRRSLGPVNCCPSTCLSRTPACLRDAEGREGGSYGEGGVVPNLLGNENGTDPAQFGQRGQELRGREVDSNI